LELKSRILKEPLMRSEKIDGPISTDPPTSQVLFECLDAVHGDQNSNSISFQLR
jgi:hypothetical protein